MVSKATISQQSQLLAVLNREEIKSVYGGVSAYTTITANGVTTTGMITNSKILIGSTILLTVGIGSLVSGLSLYRNNETQSIGVGLLVGSISVSITSLAGFYYVLLVNFRERYPVSDTTIILSRIM